MAFLSVGEMYGNNEIKIKQWSLKLGGRKFSQLSADFGDFIGVIITSNRRILFQKQYFPGIKNFLYGIPVIWPGKNQSNQDALQNFLHGLYGKDIPKAQKLYTSYMAHFLSRSKIHYYVVTAGLPKGKGLKHYDINQILEMIRNGKIKHGTTTAGILLYCAFQK
jgi:hypothetical protein